MFSFWCGFYEGLEWTEALKRGAETCRRCELYPQTCTCPSRCHSRLLSLSVILGRQEGLAGSGACCQAWWKVHGGRREETPASWSLTSTRMLCRPQVSGYILKLKQSVLWGSHLIKMMGTSSSVAVQTPVAMAIVRSHVNLRITLGGHQKP